MTSIPVTWLISIFAILLAAIVLRQIRMPIIARASFAVALISVALVAIFVGVRFQFNDPAFIVLQPYIAVITAPAFWIGFHSLTRVNGIPSSVPLTVLIAIVGMAWIIIALPYSWSASTAVIFVNTIGAVLLLKLLQFSVDHYIHVSPNAYGVLRISLFGGLAFILLVLFIDCMILGTAIIVGDTQAMALLSDAALLVVAAISTGVVIGLAFVIGTDRQDQREALKSHPLEGDLKVFEQLNTLMTDTALYRDPEITIARLGRRLSVPARSVSMAVNRVTGDNISRYINGLRITHAIDLLKGSTLSVTDIMLESGFISKSSFNTEFRRITGKTPSQYRKSSYSIQTVVPEQESKRSES